MGILMYKSLTEYQLESIGRKEKCYKCNKPLVVTKKTIFTPNTLENFFNHELPDFWNFCKRCYPK